MYGLAGRHGRSLPPLRRSHARALARAARAPGAHRGRAHRDHRPRAVAGLDASRPAQGGGARTRPARGGLHGLRAQRGCDAAGCARALGAHRAHGRRRRARRRPRPLRGARAGPQRRLADAVAGEMERHYSPGRTWEAVARAFVGLVALGDVLDAGAGDGAIAELLAPRARRITCLDRNARMVAAARMRLARASNVDVVRGDVTAIPAADAAFDQVLLLNVLTSVATPAAALAEVARVLRPGGQLVLVTLDAHTHATVTAAYGHVHAGFRPAALRRMLARAGLAVERCAVTSRERRQPHFQVITAFAQKPAGGVR